MNSFRQPHRYTILQCNHCGNIEVVVCACACMRCEKKHERTKEKLHIINYLQRTTISILFHLTVYCSTSVYICKRQYISNILMLRWVLHSNRNICTFIQWKSALQMSIWFVFVFVRFFPSVCINTICTPTTTTLYALPTWQQLTYISICEHVLKHIFA